MNPAAQTADMTALRSSRRRLVAWLVEDALPLWREAGVDRRQGGFFERLDAASRPLEAPRRTRVVARQTYVFATALRHGWVDDAATLVDHGLAFLIDRLRLGDGTFASAVRIEGGDALGSFDLYEQAFALFALAAAYEVRPERSDLPLIAARLLARLRQGWRHAESGFEESAPPSQPLKANPHMHLFEAALAWSELGRAEAQAIWRALADELATLCLTRLIDPATGAVREYFDRSWKPMEGPTGRVVEPGHQFEWAWLLVRWGQARGRADALAAARRLAVIGEEQGVDHGRGVALNELRDDFHVVDPAAKLWPQTERIKAWCALRGIAASEGEVDVAERNIDRAVDGLLQYIDAAPRGLWRESLAADGSFSMEPTRASSLYHIVCAIDTLQADARSPQPRRQRA